MLQRTSIGKRLAFAFGSLVAMAAMLLAVAAFGLHVATASLDGITGTLIPTNAITAKAKAALLQSRAAHEAMLAGFGEPALVKQARAEWDKAQAEIDRCVNDFLPFAVTAEQKDNVQVFRSGVAAYRAVIGPFATKLQDGGYASPAEAREALAPALKGYAPAFELLATIEDKVVTQGNAVFVKVKGAMSTIIAILVALCVACSVAAVLLAWRITRSVVQPVHSAIEFAQRMSEGDLSRAPRADGRDEIAQMLQVLGRMQQSLAGIVGQVRQAADNIATASQEVATGNADLSARTESMASNLQQTAASMEQITGTVQQTADSARTANQFATTSTEVARRGGALVADVVLAMDEIQERSRKIADIIGTIDGIAFQTNILALNAAVEAARAGEQGRGFAVVAAEVRSLAQRSAEAAKEIKSLINASVEKVESGSRLVRDAGSTMHEIVSGAQRVTDIMGEISASATEQSSGVGQVNSAVAQLDQVTQQNAALVEESAAAAEQLREQARRLAGVVSFFRLAATHEGQPAAATT